MANKRSPMVQAIWNDLERDVKEYTEARSAFDQAQYHFRVARERFAAIRALASNVMTDMDWFDWRKTYPEVRFVGMSVGDAITSLLWDHACDSAVQFVERDEPQFEPSIYRDEIMADLRRGGFEFKSTAPLREIHAALIHLKNVKEGESGYEHVNTEGALEWAKEFYS